MLWLVRVLISCEALRKRTVVLSDKSVGFNQILTVAIGALSPIDVSAVGEFRHRTSRFLFRPYRGISACLLVPAYLPRADYAVCSSHLGIVTG